MSDRPVYVVDSDSCAICIYIFGFIFLRSSSEDIEIPVTHENLMKGDAQSIRGTR